jgi:putative membrane protein
MAEHLTVYLANFPDFVVYFLSAALLMVLFVMVYIRTTPHPEIALIREGNTAAAVKLSGAVIGFTIPVASVIVNSVDLVDMMLWGPVALAVQVLTYESLRLVIPKLSEAIVADRVGVGIFAGSVSISIGILNAACLTY